MMRFALRMLRHRPGSVLATLIALAVGAMILTALGVLVESGLRYSPASTFLAPCRSWMEAECTTVFSTKPPVSTSRCRLRPRTRLPAS